MTTENFRQPVRHHSVALVRSGVKGPNGGEWVVAIGYTTSDKFGYFICEEVSDYPYIRYCNVTHFYQRTDEQVYQNALNEFARLYGGQPKTND